MSTMRHHAEWLSLVPNSGPFISIPVLMRAFPQGLEPRDSAQAKEMRAAYEEWQDNPGAPGKQHAWVTHVLTSVLRYPGTQIAEGQALPAGLEAKMPAMGETLRPDYALVGPVGAAAAGQPQLLIATYPEQQGLGKPVIGKHWKASPATRMMELLHEANVPLGLVTNGEDWMLVYAPRGETTGYATWSSALWLDEPITLRAFHSLLGVRRFFGVAADSTLPALLKESAGDQQEVTDQLGYQVREAVKVLVQAFDALDQENQRASLEGIAPATAYDAALTVMMRLVFLFSAEERGLLHLGEPLYDDNYAVSTLQEQLQEVADHYGEEVLERRYDAWARLLATFRAVHGGIHHQDLLMQAYGGSLFDPDRYAFLEGRTKGTHWRSTPSEPLAINNRVVLHLLSSLQRLRIKVGAGAAETRRVSFLALGVEQIGHVYEGLLDHSAIRATEVMVGIRGTRKKEPEIALSTLEALLARGEVELLNHLKEETGRSLAALRRELNDGGLFDEHKLLLACKNDQALYARLRPFAGLIREDSFERPWLVLPGSIFVTEGATRRSTGTHYTPPSLTEPIVQHTLEPLVYAGPAGGLPKEQWKLKSPKEILSLKICDMAMGSGAFLVQACRYLGERLVEAWEDEEKAHPGQVLITPDGEFSAGSPRERLVPAEAVERIAIARRVVADRCLYGVDINPMAVEMAKLSMWLVTVDATRPFTFLDHAFKCGDSLLGINSLTQLQSFRLRADQSKQEAFATLDLRQQIEAAKNKRQALEAMPSDTTDQLATKSVLYTESEVTLSALKAAADVLIHLELKGLNRNAYEAEREVAAERIIELWSDGLMGLRAYASGCIEGKTPFHWPLEFPEIFDDGGFNALIGNPPFLGGQKITGFFGTDYRNFLVANISDGRSGSANLCGYFLLRAFRLVKQDGYIGMLCPNSIAQGVTREVCLDFIADCKSVFYRAISSRVWPGGATVYFAIIWLCKGEWHGEFVLDDNIVSGITAFLSAPAETAGPPKALEALRNLSFQGSIVLGTGFLITQGSAQVLIQQNHLNSKVLQPFLTGEDLNASPTHEASRWAINFFDWPLARNQAVGWQSATTLEQTAWLKGGIVPSDYPNYVASDFPECLAIVERHVKPERTRKNSDGEFVLRKPLPQKWWIYAEKRPALYAKITKMDRVLVISRITNFVAFTFAAPTIVFSDRLAIIALSDYASFATLQSSLHYFWAWKYSVTNLSMLSYSPSTCFETFPLPNHAQFLEEAGCEYMNFRSGAMQENMIGLTEIYNRFHDPCNSTNFINELRQLHTRMDRAVTDAYGWSDLNLGHDFHQTKQGVRFTICEEVRDVILDRLLALNHQRSAEEELERDARPIVRPAKQGRKKGALGGQVELEL